MIALHVNDMQIFSYQQAISHNHQTERFLLAPIPEGVQSTSSEKGHVVTPFWHFRAWSLHSQSPQAIGHSHLSKRDDAELCLHAFEHAQDCVAVWAAAWNQRSMLSWTVLTSL